MSINSRLLNINFYNTFFFYLVKNKNNTNFETTIIEKVFNILIQNLQTSYANFKNNFRKQFFLNAIFLQIKNIKYFNNFFYKKQNLKCLFSK